eukprot:3913616-Rhodomonas_salina.2
MKLSQRPTLLLTRRRDDLGRHAQAAARRENLALGGGRARIRRRDALAVRCGLKYKETQSIYTVYEKCGFDI